MLEKRYPPDRPPARQIDRFSGKRRDQARRTVQALCQRLDCDVFARESHLPHQIREAVDKAVSAIVPIIAAVRLILVRPIAPSDGALVNVILRHLVTLDRSCLMLNATDGNAVILPRQDEKRYDYRLHDPALMRTLMPSRLAGCAMHGTGLISRLAEIVGRRELAPPPVEVLLPQSDDVETSDGPDLGYAEGQTFMIEYRSAAGELSRRRITVRNIRLSGTRVPTLSAFCHERKAMRAFRVDRIVCCIDLNGEIFDDVPAFMAENFGMSSEFASAHEDLDEYDRWNALRTFIRPEAVLLAAMTRSDGVVRNVEIETAAEILALSAERRGHVCDEQLCDNIIRYLLRLRPTEDHIAMALDRISERLPDEIKRTLLGAARVMDSDQTRHPEEIALLNAMARELIGVDVL